jgi:hypothetical protein
VKLAIKYLMSFLLDGSTHQGQTDTRRDKWNDRQTEHPNVDKQGDVYA